MAATGQIAEAVSGVKGGCLLLNGGYQLSVARPPSAAQLRQPFMKSLFQNARFFSRVVSEDLLSDSAKNLAN